MKFANKEFDTKFVIVGKEEGCGKCKNLDSFLTNAMEGKFDDQITKIKLEKNKEDYDHLVAATGAMSLPVMIDTENGNFITGFNVPEVLEMLGE